MKAYLPSYAIADAHSLHKSYEKMPLICGQLAQYTGKDTFDPKHEYIGENDFFLSLDKNFQNENIDKIHFYDSILPERNIYYPSYFYHALFAKCKLRNKNFQNYMQRGALFGLLHRHNFLVEAYSIRYFGAFASVIATKAQS